MNILQQLALLAEALFVAVAEEKKFFAPISSFVTRLRALLTVDKAQLSRDELVFLGVRLEEFFVKWRATPNSGFYIPPAQASNNDATVRQIYELTKNLKTIPDTEFDEILLVFSPARVLASESLDAKIKPKCVFIGHGRSLVWHAVKDYIDKDLGLGVVSYESDSRVGESIVPVLEKMMDQATFAVIVMTAEDATTEGLKRARQNVIHEAGLFQGRLGFAKAILLLQRQCEEFSNVAGLQYIPFTGDNVKEAFYDLQRSLKKEKQI